MKQFSFSLIFFLRKFWRQKLHKNNLLHPPATTVMAISIIKFLLEKKLFCVIIVEKCGNPIYLQNGISTERDSRCGKINMIKIELREISTNDKLFLVWCFRINIPWRWWKFSWLIFENESALEMFFQRKLEVWSFPISIFIQLLVEVLQSKLVSQLLLVKPRRHFFLSSNTADVFLVQLLKWNFCPLKILI